jgi:hypothetical protein
MAAFASARRLCPRARFIERAPFADYRPNPNSTLPLS